MVFFYRNLLSIKPEGVSSVMDMLLTCLSDENVEVREMASKALSGIVRCSQRQSIIALKVTNPRLIKLKILIHYSSDPFCYDSPEGETARKEGPVVRGVASHIALSHPWHMRTHRKLPVFRRVMDAFTD